MAKSEVIVVGGGLAGLAATMKLAELGIPVKLFSFVPVKRSHSVCAQGGINGAVNTKGEGDSPWVHFFDTVKGGDFLAHQPLCLSMCEDAPRIINLMDRMGVTFNRTNEGFIDFRRFGGTLYHRTAYAGATTGQQLLYALDEQVRRYEVEGLVEKFEFWEFLGSVLDEDGACRGITAMDLHSMEIRSFPADAVVLATGGPGLVYGRSTNSMVNNGSAAVAVYKQGAKYANGEFIQIHPTAIPGWDKHRLMSESARGEGGRVWVPKKKGDTRNPREIPEEERWYFLEEKYPRFGNLVPRDVAAKEIYHVCVDLEMGIDGENMVFLDLTHKSREELDRKLGGIMEIYEKFVGEDPREVPMRIFPAVHYSMGGLWVDYERDAEGRIVEGSPRNHMTNIPGLYAVGEVDYQYHGANRLGANSLLSCIYAGLITAPSIQTYLGGLSARAQEKPESLYAGFTQEWSTRFDEIRAMNGKINPYQLHQDLGDLMLSNVLIVRHNDRLEKTLEELDKMQALWFECGNLDGGAWANDSLRFMHHLWYMFELAKVITKGALLRNECRGAHYKPEFEISQPAGFKPDSYLRYTEKVTAPDFDGDETKLGFSPEELDYLRRFKAQNDEWLKTTIAQDRDGVPEITYEAIDTSLVPPRPRKYD